METGNLGDTESMGDGISERRTDTGLGGWIYFGRDGVEFIVLLPSGTKCQHQCDIDEARDY